MAKTVKEAVERIRVGRKPAEVLWFCWWDWNDESDLIFESEKVGEILKSIDGKGKVKLDATFKLRDSETWYGIYFQNPDGTTCALFHNFGPHDLPVWEACVGKDGLPLEHGRTFDSAEKAVAYINSSEK